MTDTEILEARDHAIQQMNYFRLHEDTRMYVFWRSVWRYYQDKSMKALHRAFFFRNEERRKI